MCVYGVKTMAELDGNQKKATKRGRKPLFVSGPAKKQRKQERDKLRGQSRISIGAEIERWLDMKEKLNVKSHEALAKILLDRCVIKINI